jgi:ADP-ribose pyrophosphatase
VSAGEADPRPAHAANPADDRLIEQRLSGERVYAGALLDVRRDRARLPDGGEAVREYIVHPGAVLVIPVLDDGRFVVERQFRYPHDRTFLEFPAGKLDPGETALATGLRELEEEAGYHAVLWTRLGVVHPCISYSTEAIEIYLARALTHVGARLDPGEFLEVTACSEADLDAALDEGRLTDAKTIVALTLLARWTSASRRSVRVRVTGVVQGVGYRDWMLRRAHEAGVAGWVRNRRDGSVEALFQGAREACDRLAAACCRGPRAAQVARVEVARAAYDESVTVFDLRPSA